MIERRENEDAENGNTSEANSHHDPWPERSIFSNSKDGPTQFQNPQDTEKEGESTEGATRDLAGSPGPGRPRSNPSSDGESLPRSFLGDDIFNDEKGESGDMARCDFCGVLGFGYDHCARAKPTRSTATGGGDQVTTAVARTGGIDGRTSTEGRPIANGRPNMENPPQVARVGGVRQQPQENQPTRSNFDNWPNSSGDDSWEVLSQDPNAVNHRPRGRTRPTIETNSVGDAAEQNTLSRQRTGSDVRGRQNVGDGAAEETRYRRENGRLYRPRDKHLYRGLPKPTRQMRGRPEETSTCQRCMDNPRHYGTRWCRWCFLQEDTITAAANGEYSTPEDFPTYIHCATCGGPTNAAFIECGLCRGAIDRDTVNYIINQLSDRRQQTRVGTYPIYSLWLPNNANGNESRGVQLTAPHRPPLQGQVEVQDDRIIRMEFGDSSNTRGRPFAVRGTPIRRQRSQPQQESGERAGTRSQGRRGQGARARAARRGRGHSTRGRRGQQTSRTHRSPSQDRPTAELLQTNSGHPQQNQQTVTQNTDTKDPVVVMKRVIRDPEGHSAWIILGLLILSLWMLPMVKADGKQTVLGMHVGMLSKEDEKGRLYCAKVAQWLFPKDCERQTKMIEYLPEPHTELAFMEVGKIYLNKGFAFIELPVYTEQAVGSLREIKTALYQEKADPRRPSKLSDTNLTRMIKLIDYLIDLLTITDTSLTRKKRETETETETEDEKRELARTKRSLSLFTINMGDSVKHFWNGINTALHGKTFHELVQQTNVLSIKTDALQAGVDNMKNSIQKLANKMEKSQNTTMSSINRLAGLININEYTTELKSLGEELHNAANGGFLGTTILPYRKADGVILDLKLKLQKKGMAPAIANREDLYELPTLRKVGRNGVTFYIMVPTIGIRDKPLVAYEVNPLKMVVKDSTPYEVQTDKDILAIEDTFDKEANSLETSFATFGKDCNTFGPKTFVCDGIPVAKTPGETCLASIILRWNTTKCKFKEISTPQPRVAHYRMIQRRTTYFPTRTQARITCRGDDREDVIIYGLQTWSNRLSQCALETDQWHVPPRHVVLGENEEPILVPIIQEPNGMEEIDGWVETRRIKTAEEEDDFPHDHSAQGVEVEELGEEAGVLRKGPSTLAIAAVVVATLALVWVVAVTGIIPVAVKVVRGELARPVQFMDSDVMASVIRNWKGIRLQVGALSEPTTDAQGEQTAFSAAAHLEDTLSTA